MHLNAQPEPADAHDKASLDDLRHDLAHAEQVVQSLQLEIDERDRLIYQLHTQLAAITNGPGWKLLGMIWPIRHRLIPPHSRRERMLQLAVHGLGVLRAEGPGSFIRKTGTEVRRLRNPAAEIGSAPRELDALADATPASLPLISIIVAPPSTSTSTSAHMHTDELQVELDAVKAWLQQQSFQGAEIILAEGDFVPAGTYICRATHTLLRQPATFLETNLMVLECESLAFTVNLDSTEVQALMPAQLQIIPWRHLDWDKVIVRADCIGPDWKLNLTGWLDQRPPGEEKAGKLIGQTPPVSDSPTLTHDGLSSRIVLDDTAGIRLRQADRYILAKRGRTNTQTMPVANPIGPVKLHRPHTSFPMLPCPSELPTVLVFMPFMAVGGAERITLDMARSLSDKVRFVFVTTEQHAAELGSMSRNFQAVTPFVYAAEDFLDPALHLSFLQYLIERFQIHSLYIANGAMWIYTVLAALKQHCPELRVIGQVYDYEAGWINIYNPALSQYFDAHIGVNQKILDEYVQRGARREDTFLIEHSVDTDRFDSERYSEAQIQALRQTLGIPDGNRVVVFVARLHAQKRPMDFVELARRFVNEPTITFLMAGDGPMSTDINLQVARSQLKNFIRLPFYAPSSDIFAVADVVVLPSEYEGLPVVVLEAQAMGKPVVVTDVGGNRELLERTHGGVVISQIGDLNQLRAGVASLLANPPDAQRRRHMRDTILADFNPDRIAQKYASALIGTATNMVTPSVPTPSLRLPSPHE